MLYMVKITGHVLWSLILSLKGFIPSVHKPNRTFLRSSLNSLCFSSNLCHWLQSTGCAILSSSTLHSSSHHVMSVSSLAFRKIRLKRSVTGRYHITKAGILLCFASLPNGVSSRGWDSCTTFLYPSYSSFSQWRVHPHCKGHCSYTGWPHTRDIYPVTWTFHHEKVYSGWGMHRFFSTPIVNGLMTFFVWYVLAGTEFGCGSTHDRRCNISLKLQSDQSYLAFRMSSSSTKRSNVQCVGHPFLTPYTISFDAFVTLSKNF
jgi:hypothetical protein